MKRESRKVGENEQYDLEGQWVKTIMSSKIFDFYTRLETLLGVNLSGHTDTLTKASNLKDESSKRGEIPKEQQYRNDLDKFCNN